MRVRVRVRRESAVDEEGEADQRFRAREIVRNK